MAIVVVPMAVFSSPDSMLHLRQPHAGSIALGLGIISTVMPTLCYSFAAKHLSPILTTTLNLLTPIVAAIVAVLLLKEQFPVMSAIGAIAIVGGILALSLPKARTTD